MSRRPWLYATTPLDGHPRGPGGDSTATLSPPPARSRATATHVEPGQTNEQFTTTAVWPIAQAARIRGRHSLRHRRGLPGGCLVATDPEGLDPLTPAHALQTILIDGSAKTGKYTYLPPSPVSEIPLIRYRCKAIASAAVGIIEIADAAMMSCH